MVGGLLFSSVSIFRGEGRKEKGRSQRGGEEEEGTGRGEGKGGVKEEEGREEGSEKGRRGRGEESTTR